MKDQIRILTINTWKCDGDYFERMKVLSRQLAAGAFDVIICQEVFVTEDNTINTLEFLAGELNMHALFTKARAKIRKVGNERLNSFSGLGILSKFPAKLVEELDLPTSQADGGRKAQLVEIETGNGHKMLIANIHLTFLKDADELRTAQLNVIAGKLWDYNAYKYRLIAGDFNAEVDAGEIVDFKKNAVAADCYLLGNGTEPRTGRSGPDSFRQHRCVDHIFCLPVASENRFPGFCQSEIVLDTPDPATGLYPSDHFGIATTLLLH